MESSGKIVIWFRNVQFSAITLINIICKLRSSGAPAHSGMKASVVLLAVAIASAEGKGIGRVAQVDGEISPLLPVAEDFVEYVDYFDFQLNISLKDVTFTLYQRCVCFWLASLISNRSSIAVISVSTGNTMVPVSEFSRAIRKVLRNPDSTPRSLSRWPHTGTWPMLAQAPCRT